MEKNEIKNIIEQYINNSRLDEALLLIEQYKKTFEIDEEIASMEAIINYFYGNYDEAIKCINAGLRVNSLSSDLYYTLGNVYEAKNDVNRAYLCYEQAVATCTKDENIFEIRSRAQEMVLHNNINVKNVSFVILTYNQLEYTKVCIDSIRKNCAFGTYEIIIVDNHSTDGTVEWLKEQKDIKVIYNEENKGFPKGCNQGIKLAEKDNDIFLLNNDTVMMRNSLFNMRMALYSDNLVGAVGAISNSVSYYQQVILDCKTFDEYIQAANNINVTNEEFYESRIKLVGFAMLIKRGVLEQIGYLDERFTPGNYEDDDISYRIIENGNKLILAKDSYIHHFGSVSFKEDIDKYSELLETNCKKFEEKWGFISEKSNEIRLEYNQLIEEDRNTPLNILEIGCKCGATLLNLKSNYPNANIYGIDKDKEALKICSKFAKVYCIDIEKEELDFEEGYFDYIALSNIDSGDVEIGEVIRKVKKYLKRDAYIIGKVINANNYEYMEQYNRTMKNEYNKLKILTYSELMYLFKRYQFKNIKILNEFDNINEELKIKVRQSMNRNDEEMFIKKYCFKSKKMEEDIYLRRQLTRIDFDCYDEESNIVSYILEKNITDEVIKEIIDTYMVNKVKVLNSLAIMFFNSRIDDRVLFYLNNSLEIAEDKDDTLYYLGYILSIYGEKKLALDYLEQIKNKSEDVNDLIVEIKG